MVRSFTLVALLVFSSHALAADDAQSAPAEPADMKCIFNGTDLTGWDGDPRLWSVKDGALRGETTAENAAQGNTFIIWKDGVLKDFELRLSFRCNATNNSGIQYRSRHITEGSVRNKWVVRGYQHEIRNENKLPSVSGFIYDEGGKRGRMCLVGEQAVWGEDGQKQVTGTLISAEEYRAAIQTGRLERRRHHRPRSAHPALPQQPPDPRMHGQRPRTIPPRRHPRPAAPRGIPDVGRVQEFTPQEQRMRPRERTSQPLRVG